MKTLSTHQDRIINQFTRQATPFADKPEHRDALVMARMLEFAGVTERDVVLDVACGPGLVACAFAEKARSVTGIDLTPAMIAKARERQAVGGQSNLSWDIGDSTALPYADGSFSLVITRYSFHHFPDPLAAWKEMVRVCQPGGTILVADVALPEEKREAYDRFEIMRDPSHSRALTLKEFSVMAVEAGLEEIRTDFYRLEMELEALIDSSFPEPENRQRLLDLMRADVGRDDLGFAAEKREGKIWFSFPILVTAGKKREPTS